MLRTSLKAAVVALALMLLALPALADDHCCDHPGVALVEDTVSQIVMNDLLSFYPPGEDVIGHRCVEHGNMALCVHPDTDRERMEEILRNLPTWEGEEGERYYRLDRWVTTAMDGSTGNYGDAIHLTYSFLPDGTYIPGGGGESGASSNLYSRLNGLFGGDTAAWKQIFADCFADWSSHIGIQYTEVSDDGATFPHQPGVLGSRGDVRIGMHYIDGVGGTLAYNYFPDQGDMVMDSSENWGNSYLDYRQFRNVVMHEHGHGHGLGHPTPNDHTKLMEAYLNTNFLGPREDDIRGGGRNYGDPWDAHDGDTAGATDLGDFQGTLILEDHFLYGSYDYDFFAFSVPVLSSLDVILDPLGQPMYLGYEGGGSPTLVYTDEMMDLQFTLWKDVAGTPTEIANFNNTGYDDNETVTDYSLDPGDYWIEVHKAQGYDVQRYRLTLDVFWEDLTPVEGGAPPTGLALSVFPNPFNPKTTLRFMAPEAGQYQVDIFDSRGRRVNELGGRAAEAGWVELEWNGRDEAGRALPSGIYFMRARAGDFSETLRGVLLK